MKDTLDKTTREACLRHQLAIRDTLDVVGGKWKLPITHALCQGPKRFKELQREIGGITPRVLSKELKDLEMNDLVRREVYATAPVTVEYSLTPYGRTLRSVITALYDWGQKHRKRILQGKKATVD